MDRDGTEDGYELELTRAVADAVDIPVIASGGAGDARPPGGRGRARRRGRRAVRVDLPLRHLQRRRGQGGHARRRDPRPSLGSDLRFRAVRKVQEELRERIRALPGMERLLPALDGLPPRLPGRRRRARPPARAAGGGRRPRGRGRRAADGARARRAARRRRASRTSASARRRSVPARSRSTSPRTRAESYPEPGALPVVRARRAERGPRPARLHDQRDGGGAPGRRARPPARPARRIAPTSTRDIVRVLHDRSFIDDPTRLLRAVRYEVRLDFRMDEPTEELARKRRAGTRSRPVSGPRIRDELLDLLAEHAAPRGVARLAELGLLESLGGGLNGDAELVASAKLGAGETGADPALAALAALLGPEPDAAWVESLGLRADERDAVLRAARKAPQLAKTGARRPAGLGDPRAAPLRAPGDARADARLRGAGRPDPALPGRPPGRPARDHRRRPGRGGRAGVAARSGARSRRRCARSSTASSRAATRSCATRWRWHDRRADPGRACRARRSRSRPAIGGVSEGPYESLNLGILTDDDRARVEQQPRAPGRGRRHRRDARSRWAGRCTAPTSRSG